MLQLSKTIALLGVFGALTAVLGCAPAAWNVRGDGFPADQQQLTSGLRPKDRNATGWGYSTKAQQIEQNLGVSRR